MDPTLLQGIRIGIREVSAFVGHSFAEEDEQVVNAITQFLTKLGLRCDSGKRAEPRGVSDKVRARIEAAEVFVGIFTRRGVLSDGCYSTSPWIVEEKGAAISGGKKLLLFVEDGVNEFGGLQGDYEYIPFSRDNLGPALITTLDYVLAITGVPMRCRIEGSKVHFDFPSRSPQHALEELQKAKLKQPNNVSVRMHLARLLKQLGKQSEAIAEWKDITATFPNVADAHHELAHLYEQDNRAQALISFQKALDLDPRTYRNYRCYGRCLCQESKLLGDPIVKRSTLEKAKRLLERAAVIGGEKMKQEIDGDLFNAAEALAELPVSENPIH